MNWKPIPDHFPYEASDTGLIRHSKKGDIVSQHSSYGYRRCSLRQNGRNLKRRVHRLVLFAFVGPCPPGHQAAHLDGDQTNNTLSNLKWVTPKENSGHRIIHGTQPAGEDHWRSELNSKKVLQIRKEYWFRIGPTGPSSNSKELSERYGVNQSTIRSIVRRKTWKHL